MSGAADTPMPEAARQSAETPDVVPAYVEALETGAASKAALFAQWIAPGVAGTIVDVGCGPGGVAVRLAALRPACRVFGIDADPNMIALARARHGGPANLVFRLGQAERLPGTGSLACVLSSVLHEVAAQGGLAAVEPVLRCAAAGLARAGRLIVRDFVRPSDATRPVALRHARHDMRRGHSFSDFARAATFTVRFEGYGIDPDALSYGTDLEGAYEFALRKDCGEAWAAELRQRYAFWTEAECRRLVQGAGLRILHLGVRDDPWIVERRIRNRLSLLDRDTGASLPVPAAKLVVVAEKP